MSVRKRKSPRRKPRGPAHGAAVLSRQEKAGPVEETADATDLPNLGALTSRIESQRLELLRAMACVHLARRTIEEHVAEPRHGDVIPLRPEQHENYRQRVLEALSVADDALATAYPMLERIAQALDVDEMLKEYEAEHAEPPPARRSAAPGAR